MENTQARPFKTQSQLEALYKGGRSSLLMLTILTVVNVLLAVFEAEWTFLLTAFLPYVCASLAPYWYLGLPPAVCLTGGCLLPLVLFLLCYLNSRELRFGWMRAAAILFALDTVYMLLFILLRGFDGSMIPLLLFHALLLWQLFRASAAGARLARGEYAKETPLSAEIFPDAAPDDGEPAAVFPDGQAQHLPAVYRFDRSYAVSTGAAKTGRILAVIFVFFAWMAGGAALIWSLTLHLDWDFGLPIALTVAVSLGAIAWFIVRMVRLSPFLEEAVAHYHTDAAGRLIREKPDLPPFDHVVFLDMELLETRPDAWVVRYVNPRGRVKKTVIPNAYPGLDAYMDALPPARR